MKVLVVGASGKTGRLVVKKLLAQKQQVRALVRRETAAVELEALGAESVVADLTGDVSHTLTGCEAVVFAAGAGMTGDPEEVDYRGVVKLIEAAKAQGVSRFVMVSSLGTGYAEQMPEMLKPYLEAKHKAEKVLEESGLTYTTVKPGGLTDNEETGKVTLAETLDQSGSISRADVAEIVTEVLLNKLALKASFEVISGDTPIADALATL